MKINDATPPATTTYPGMIEIATDAEAAAETATDKALVPSNIPSMSVTPDAHNTSHQNGGSDEISVAGLSGLLADDQHVLDAEVQAISINSVSEDTTPQLGGTLDCNGNAIGGTTPGTGTFTTLKGQTLEGEHTAPTLTLHNTTEQDTNYGRPCELRFKGEQSGGEETTLGIIQAAHDGTADDQKGILTFKVNDGNDGDSPTDVLTIDSAGRIGVGKTDPTFALDIAAQVETARAFRYTQARGDGNDPITFLVTRSSRGTIASPLPLQTNDGITGFLGYGYGATGWSGDVRVGIRGNAEENWSNSAQGSYLSFHTTASGGASFLEKMRLDGSGKLGIGTAGPETLLELSSTEPYLTLHNTTEEDGDYGRESEIRFKGEQSGGEETTLAIIQVAHDGTSDDQKGILTFKINDGNDGDSPTSALTIQSDGKVGINSTSPTARLESIDSTLAFIAGSNTSSSCWYIKDNFLNAAYGQASDTGGWINYEGYLGEASQFRDLLIGDGKQGLIAIADGNTSRVGIHTYSPDRSLHIEEDNAATNTAVPITRFSLTSTGTPAAGLGPSVEFEVETAAGGPGNQEIIATIDAIATDVSSGSEDGALVFKLMTAGAAATERFRIGSTGALTITDTTGAVVDTDETKFSHKLAVTINGATYYIMLTQT